MTMIERVARAILKSRFYDCEPGMYDNDPDVFFREIDPDHATDAHGEARAAIEAMREPTDGMLDKAVPVYERDEYHMSTFHCLGEAYKEMIDAALEETPCPTPK